MVPGKEHSYPSPSPWAVARTVLCHQAAESLFCSQPLFGTEPPLAGLSLHTADKSLCSPLNWSSAAPWRNSMTTGEPSAGAEPC